MKQNADSVYIKVSPKFYATLLTVQPWTPEICGLILKLSAKRGSSSHSNVCRGILLGQDWIKCLLGLAGKSVQITVCILYNLPLTLSANCPF